MEALCSIAVWIGFIWIIVNILKKKEIKKPLILTICFALTGTFLFGTQPNSNGNENVQVSEEIQKSSEDDIEMFSSESKAEEFDTKTLGDTVLYDLESKEAKRKDDVLIDSGRNLNEILVDLFGSEIGLKLNDILVNQIGFKNVEYVGKNSFGTDNYDFTSDNYNFTVTVGDDVYRVFQPNGGATFYADGEVKLSMENIVDKNDGNVYYIIAKEMVEGGLKNPSSADFPSIITHPEQISFSKNDNIVAVQSYVEAQNSFGAVVSNTWIAEFIVTDADSLSYEPLYLKIGSDVLYGEYIDLN